MDVRSRTKIMRLLLVGRILKREKHSDNSSNPSEAVTAEASLDLGSSLENIKERQRLWKKLRK